jgi:arylsulfatase A-like enzyme
MPGQRLPIRVSSPVEFIDIYPTLCELLSLPVPQKDQLQGRSFAPQLKGEPVSGKRYAVGRNMAGDTIFDGRYRYSEFRTDRGAGELLSRMLYDHLNDPNEDVNVIDDTIHKAIVEELAAELYRVRQLP